MSLQATVMEARCEWPDCRVSRMIDGGEYQAYDELREDGWVEVNEEWYCPAHVDASRQRAAGQLKWEVRDE